MFRLKLEGHSFPEIMTILGERSINTIYTWDLRCRKQLLALMGGRWEAHHLDGKGKRPSKERVG